MLNTAHSQDYVPCEDQQEACECDENLKSCRFRLEIEELQTFTSYRIQDGEIVTRGTPGDTYFFNEQGFNPSLDSTVCKVQRPPPECGNCTRSQGTPIPEEQKDSFRTELSCSIPATVDGRTYRLYIAVNGSIPGPTLVVTEGQEVIVEVYNKLTSEGISIHWHGMHQRGTPWMDGVASLSHIPIVPGGTFQYKFTASPAGTHWYHSHLGAQRTDGLFGGLIVRERSSRKMDIEDKLDLGTLTDNPSEHTLSLLDWQRESSLNLFVQIHSTLGFYPTKPLGEVPRSTSYPLYNRTNSTDGIEVGPVPFFSGLINGKGRYDASTYSILSIFNVITTQKYRFRLIGAQSLYAFRFEIDGHRLQVIATDGHFIEPVTVDYIIIHSGERYDFVPVLMNTNAPLNNYMIRAKTLEQHSDTRDHAAEAILHYEGASIPDASTMYNNVYSNSQSRCTSVRPCKALNCPFENYPTTAYIECINVNELNSLFPTEDDKLPTLGVGGDQLLFFNFGFEGQSSTSAINGKNFLPPATPYQTNLGQYDADKRNGQKNTCGQCTPSVSPEEQATKCTCINVKEIFNNAKPTDSQDKSIVMVFSAVGDEVSRNRDFAHPIHLHGHSFFVVHVGHGQYAENGTLLENSPDIMCDNTLCMNSSWINQTAPEFQRSENGKVNKSAIQKDTVMLPAGGYVVVAFLADNPGYWFLHCHIEVHQLEGMAIVIREYSDSEQPAAPPGINNVGEYPPTYVNMNNMNNQNNMNNGGGYGHYMTTNVWLNITFVFIFVSVFF